MSITHLSTKEEYKETCAQHKTLPVYFQDWWLDVLCGNENWTGLIQHGHNNRVDGIWPIPFTKYYGLNVTRHPPLTPFLGMKIFLPNDIQKTTSKLKFRQKVCEELIAQFKSLNLVFFNQHFSEENNDLQPLFWNGFKQQTYSRFVISNIKTKQILNTFDGDIRTNIKKAGEIVRCLETKECPELYSLLVESFKSSKNTIPYEKETLEQLLLKVFENTASKFIVAKKDEKTIGACLILVDHEVAYLNCLGVNSEYRNSGISSLLIWKGIQFAAQHVNSFDFSGSMIPNISNFFRGFGGEKISYNNVKWYRNAFYKFLHQGFNS